jgi:hypothetical protein
LLQITPEQWRDYTNSQTRLAELEAAEARRVADAAAAEVRALQAKGHIEQAFALQRTQAETALTAERERLKQVEDRARRYALDGELARALAGHPLVVGGAEQLTKLIRHEFTVEGQGETFVVRSADFRAVPDYVAAVLARPEYAHFLRAQNPGGGTGGAQGTQAAPTGPAQPTPEPAIASMSDYAIWHHKNSVHGAANAAATGGSVIGEDGRQLPRPAAGFGLHPQTARRA